MFCASLVEIGTVILEKIFFFILLMYIRYYLPLEKGEQVIFFWKRKTKITKKKNSSNKGFRWKRKT